ncbi:MAG: hypothetical protein IJ737_00275 [Ruminococcus sp.]|nr:hypothetical protein [Ruminococcus sp.]
MNELRRKYGLPEFRACGALDAAAAKTLDYFVTHRSEPIDIYDFLDGTGLPLTSEIYFVQTWAFGYDGTGSKTDAFLKWVKKEFKGTKFNYIDLAHEAKDYVYVSVVATDEPYILYSDYAYYGADAYDYIIFIMK